MWPHLALVALLQAVPAQDPVTGVVRGEVRNERTGEPVPFAVVEVAGSLVPLVAVADSLGGYQLRGIPAGRQLLRARGLDHSPLAVEVFVPAGREVRIDFSLQLQPVVLPGVVVQGRSPDRSGESRGIAEPELGRAVVRSLEATPGVAELGLVEMSRALPPGQEPIDPTDVLYVRGAAADFKLVLLDGAPVYAPFHVGGLLQAFEPDLVAGADLYLGGAPARYDGGLSYVLDLETRAGGRSGAQLSGMADLLTARVLAEAPLGERGGVLIGARTVHGAGAGWILRDGFPYGYGDLLGRLDLAAGDAGVLSLSGFWNRESISLAGMPAAGTDEAVWGNLAASLRYRGPMLGQEAEFTLAAGGYRARLPLGGAATQRVVADGMAWQSRLAADFRGGGEALKVHYGLSFEQIIFEQVAWAAEYSFTETALAGGGFRYWNRPLLAATEFGLTSGLYADLDWAASGRVRLRSGLRLDHFHSTEEKVRLAPRLSLVWAPSDRAVLTIAGGRYRQFVRASTEVLPGSEGFGAVHAPESLRLAQATHLLLGVDQLLADEVRFGIEGYFKRFDGVPTGNGTSHANASGVDLWLRRSEGRVTGWLGYSLGWIWTGAADGSATDLFTGRQLLSVGLSGKVGAGGMIGLRVGYGAGVPYSALPSDGVGVTGNRFAGDQRAVALNTAREMVVEAPLVAAAPDAPYLRLDAEASYPLAARWGGARFTLTPYLRIYNALDRRDAFFYHAAGDDGDRPRPLGALPVLPVLGLQWKF